VNNTVLYVGSQAHGRGQHSTVGMVHQLVVARNVAYSAAQIARLSERTRPAASPALRRLLRAHGISSLDGICPAPVPSSFYEAVDWGLCPQEVCGDQCINENIYLGEVETNFVLSQEKQDLRAQTAQRLGLGDGLPTPGGNTHRSSAATEGLPAVGHPLGADGIFDGGNEVAASFDPFELALGSSVLQVLLPVLASFNLGWLALLLGLQTSVPDLAAPSDTAARSAGPAPKTRSKRSKAKANRREGQAQELYSAAMARSADHSEWRGGVPGSSDNQSGEASSGVLDVARAVNAEGFTSWRERADEEARAALILGMWLAEDASVGMRDPRDQPWNFKEAPLLSQPMHLSLGYRAGYGAVSDNYVPFDEVDALLSTTNDSFLIPLLESAVTVDDALPLDRADDGGQFYIDTETMEEKLESQGAPLEEDQRREIHDKYQFTVNKRGEIIIAEAGDIDHSAEAANTVRAAAPSPLRRRPSSWLRVFANLTTDSVKAALQSDLAELVEAGLNSSFVHSLILDRQRGRHDIELGKGQDQSPNMAKIEATTLSVQSSPRDFREASPGAADCAAAAAYYFPVTQYVAAQFGASHSGAGPLEEVRLIVSGGTPEGHRGRGRSRFRCDIVILYWRMANLIVAGAVFRRRRGRRAAPAHRGRGARREPGRADLAGQEVLLGPRRRRPQRVRRQVRHRVPNLLEPTHGLFVISFHVHLQALV
jgi:hypothetical protein